MTTPIDKLKFLSNPLRLVFLLDSKQPEWLKADTVQRIALNQEPSLLKADLIVVGEKVNTAKLANKLELLSHEAGAIWLEKPNAKLAKELASAGFKELDTRLFQKKSGSTPEEYGQTYIDRWGETNWLKNARLAANQILEHTPKGFSKKTSKILDVGCLNGYIMESLHREGVQNIYGTDISYFLAVERQINPWHLAGITVGDFSQNQYPSRSFDVTICMEVLEHIPPESTHRFIKELARVTSNSGIILISTSEDWQADETHINCRNRAQWYVEFAKAGLVSAGKQEIFPGFNSFVLRHGNLTENLRTQISARLELLKTGKLPRTEVNNDHR